MPKSKGIHKEHKHKAKITDATVEEAVQCIRRGFKIRDMIEYLGFSKSAWYEIIQERPDIQRRLNRAKQTYHLELATKARELAVERGDREMIKFLLSRRFSYNERHEVKLTDGSPKDEMSREELIEQILKIANRNQLPVTQELH